MRLTFTLIFITLQLIAHGQGYFILNDGQKIRFNKFSESQSSVLLKEPGKKEKTEIKIADVRGYFSDYEETLYYAKPEVDGSSKTYQFVTRALVGKINLYEKIVIYPGAPSAPGSPPIPPTTINYFFIEKSGRFEPIFESHSLFQNKKKEIDLLKLFVADDSQSLKTIDDNFKLNKESLKEVIRAYNLASHTKEEEKGDGKNFGTAIFFRTGKDLATNLADRIKYGKASDNDIRISVCDSTYTLKDYGWIEVQPPAEKLVKVCLGDTNPHCEIISANPYFPIRFEVRQDKNSKLITLESKDFEANLTIEKLKDHRPKKRK